MSSALEQLEYTTVPGVHSEHNLKLYALSTCGFCKTAMNYLAEKGYQYHYIHLDQIDLDLKRAAKLELKGIYDNLPVFPILTIDDTDAISGFVETKWAERLGIE